MDGQSLINRVEPVRRAVKRLLVLQATGWWVTAVLAALILAVGADYLLDLPPIPRVLAGALAITWVIWGLRRWVIAAVAERVELAAVGQAIETALPEVRGSVASAIGFAAGQDGASAANLRGQAVRNAENVLDKAAIGRLINKQPALRSAALVAGVAAAAVVGGIWLGPDARGIAARRWLSPFAGAKWPQTTEVAVVGALPAKVGWGDTFPLTVRLTRGDGEARLVKVLVEVEGNGRQEQLLARQTDGTFTAQIETGRPPTTGVVGKSRMTLTIQSGDATATAPDVAIVPRASVLSATVQSKVPAYAGTRTASVADALRGPVRVVEGSVLAIDVTLSKPAGSDIVWGGAGDILSPPVAALRTADGTHLTATWVASTTLKFGLTGTDSDGLAIRLSQPLEVNVVPDAPPTVQLTSPIAALQLTAEADLELASEAADDMGLRQIDAVIFSSSVPAPIRRPLWQDGAASAAVQVEAKREGDGQRVTVAARRPVSAWLGTVAAPGSNFDIAVGVHDNFLRVQNGNQERHAEVLSSRVRLAIISQDQLAGQVSEEIKQTSAALSRLLAEHQTMTEQLSDLSDGLASRPADAADKQQLSRMSDQLSSTASAARSMSEKLSNLTGRLVANRSPRDDLKASASEAAALLAAAGTDMLPKAQAEARESALSEVPQAQRKQAAAATEDARTAAGTLSAALARLGSADGLSDAVASAKALADAQKKLAEESQKLASETAGKQPGQWSGEQTRSASALAARQADLRTKAEAMLQSMSRQAQQPATEQAAKDGLNAAVNTARDKQLLGNASAAAGQLAKSSPSSAVPSQQSAAEALAMMVDELQKAQAELAKQLGRQLAELQQQVEALVLRQALHNASTLAVLGRWIPESPDYAATFPHLAAAAVPLINKGQLASEQKQTHRNTVDLARTVTVKPGMAEMGSRLVRVASSMERAAAYLATDQLAEAYQPPQAKALTELVKLSGDIAKQLEKDKDKEQEKKRQQLRALFEQLKSKQTEIMAGVAAVDQNRTTNSGNLSRAERVEVLPRLADRQRQIGLAIKETETRLKELQSTVYLWLNAKIGEESAAASAELVAQRTGEVVQTHQSTVIGLIDAMLQSLKVVPLPKEFSEQAAGGGGGGGGGEGQTKPMPQEAELRLLRELQRQVNQQTKRLAVIDPPKAAGEQKSRLAAPLAVRQAELRQTLIDLFVNSKRQGFKAPPEPDPNVTFAEDGRPGAIDDAALDQELLNGKPADEAVDDVATAVLIKMAMSRQRLDIKSDAGQETQRLQKSLLAELDILIDQARKNPSNGGGGGKGKDDIGMKQPSNPGQSEPKQGGGKAGGPKAGQGQPMAGSTSGSGAKTESSSGGSYSGGGDPSKPLAEVMKEWGTITPRQRQAIIEGASDQMIEKYRTEIEAYYRSLGDSAAAGGGTAAGARP